MPTTQTPKDGGALLPTPAGALLPSSSSSLLSSSSSTSSLKKQPVLPYAKEGVPLLPTPANPLPPQRGALLPSNLQAGVKGGPLLPTPAFIRPPSPTRRGYLIEADPDDMFGHSQGMDSYRERDYWEDGRNSFAGPPPLPTRFSRSGGAILESPSWGQASAHPPPLPFTQNGYTGYSSQALIQQPPPYPHSSSFLSAPPLSSSSYGQSTPSYMSPYPPTPSYPPSSTSFNTLFPPPLPGFAGGSHSDHGGSFGVPHGSGLLSTPSSSYSNYGSSANPYAGHDTYASQNDARFR